MEEQEAAANVNAVSANTDVSAENAVNESAETTVTGEAAACCCCGCGENADNTAAEEEKAERKERVRKEVTPDMLERTQKDLMKMLDFLGYDDAVVKTSEENGEIILSVESEDAGRIIGRKGQTLESIQLLLNRMAQKDDPDYPRIQIVVDGYSSRHPVSRGRNKEENGEKAERGERRPRRERRERTERGERRPRRERRENNDGDEFSGHDEQLRQQALDAAKEVRHWGSPVTLPPMNAHDRRIIHITLEQETDLCTESEGNGAKKPVTISLRK